MTTRLTQLDWLDHGLEVLASTGPAALKADTLAKLLKVSRGSFYWHFQDIHQFHAALLLRWRELATDDIINSVDQECAVAQRLPQLMRSALTSDGRVERGIRSWAAQNATAASTIAAVDKVRVNYLKELLRLAGLSEPQARARASFIYWAYVGRVMVEKGAKGIAEDDIISIADLLQSGHD